MQGCTAAHRDRDGVAIMHLTCDRTADIDALARLHIVDDVVSGNGVERDPRCGGVHAHSDHCAVGAVGAARCIGAADRSADRLACQDRTWNVYRELSTTGANGGRVGVGAYRQDHRVARLGATARDATHVNRLTRLHIADDVVHRNGVQADGGKRLVYRHLNRSGGRARAARSILRVHRGTHAAVINGAGCNGHAEAAIGCNSDVLCQRHAIGCDADRLARHCRVHLAAERGVGCLSRHPIDRVRGDKHCCRVDRWCNEVQRETSAGALRRNAARCVLMRHRGRHRFGIAAEVAGIDDKAKAQGLADLQVNDRGADLCSIAQGQRDGVANRYRTANRAADGDGPCSVDGGDESDRIQGDMRRGRVRAHIDGGAAGAVVAAIGIDSADRCADRLTGQC